MIENEFTQLPVVDKDGDLAGIISEQRIIRSPSPGEGHRLSQETRLLRLLASEEQGNQKALSTPVDEIEWHFSSTGVESAFWFPCSLGYHLPHIDRLK